MKTALPTSYPMEGTYQVSFVHVRLGCATPNAVIYYTTDGTEPSENSASFVPESEAFSVFQFGEGKRTQRKDVTIKAFAKAPGLEPSEITELHYTFISDAPGSFRTEILREGTEDTPALIKIVDFATVCMYLVVGSERAVLIDAGASADGDLKGLVTKLIGNKPFDVVIAHAHGDHVGQVRNFLAAGIKVYGSDHDLVTYTISGGKAPEGIININDGDVFDLGNSALTAYWVPGHAAGGMVLLDPKTGDLYSSDELGNNDPIGPNAGLMVIGTTECCVENYYKTLVSLKEKLAGRAKRVFTAHNAFPVDADLFLNNALTSIKYVLDNGDSVLKPSIRDNRSNCGSASMISSGEYRVDPAYFGINIKYLYEKDAIENKPVQGFDMDYFQSRFSCK